MSSAVPHRLPHPVPHRVRTSRGGRALAGYADRVRLTVVPRRRTRAPRVPFVTLVTLILVGGVVGLLLFNTSMQQASFATTKLEQQATALGLRQQTLQLQLQRMRAPDRVARRAAALGMELGGMPLFLDLETGRLLGDRVAAATTTRLRLEPYPARRPDSLIPQRVVAVLRQGSTTNAPAGTPPGALTNSPADTAAASPRAGTAAGRNGEPSAPSD